MQSTHPEKIIKVKRIGNIRTVDIEVDNQSHTFYANGGIVTSNSHAVCYGKDAYWTAFCKAHFPAQFYCSYIDGAQWKPKPYQEIYEIVNDAKMCDVEIHIPDFRDMELKSYIKDNKVYFGLGNIKGIGEASLNKINNDTLNAELFLGKKIKRWTWIDFLFCLSVKLSSTTVNALILSGALDFFSMSRNKMLYEYQAWSKVSEPQSKIIIQRYIDNKDKNKEDGLLKYLNESALLKKEGGVCHSKVGVVNMRSIIHTLENPPHSLNDTPDFIAWNEEMLLGAPITCHRVDSCADSVHANTTCKEFLAGKGGYIVLAVEIASVRQLTTKKGKNPGQQMAAASVTDGSCSLDNVVVFPDAWSQFGSMIYEGNTLLIQGERDKKQGSLVVKKVWQI